MPSLLMVIILSLVPLLSPAQLRVGPLLGFNLANVAFSSGGEVVTGQPKLGIRIGGTLHFALADQVDLNTGLLYAVKGYTDDDLIYTYQHLNYVELPLSTIFKKPLNDRLSLLAQAGFFLGFGVGGSLDPFRTDGLGLNPVDFGLNVGVGTELHFTKHDLQIKLGYQPSLADLELDSPSLTMLNQVFTLSVDYLFGL